MQMNVVDTLNKFWTEEHKLAAKAEGWYLSECDGSMYGPVQIQKIDDPTIDPLPDGTVPPTLEMDEDAWKIVCWEEKPHHSMAMDLLMFLNPSDYLHIRSLRRQA
jgi:hypothetical protein